MRRWILVVCVVLGGPGVAPAKDVLPEECPRTRGQMVMELVNAERTSRGLAPLRVDLHLARASLAHARDLSTGPESGHRGSDGSEPARRADRAGYEWMLIGENVAAGLATPEEVVAGWMGSPPHRHNILDARFTDAAVGFEREAASRWGTYWVMMFGTTAKPDVGLRATCNP